MQTVTAAFVPTPAYIQPQSTPFPQSMDPSHYAQYLLESYASSNNSGNADDAGSASHHVDESLGSYVVSLLQVETEEDTESREALVELLQEHCNLSEKLAGEALDQIRHVLRHGTAPMSSFYSVTTDQEIPDVVQSPMSPLHEADVLIPGDLLGELDADDSIRQLRHQPAGQLDDRHHITAQQLPDPFPPLSVSTPAAASRKPKPARSLNSMSNPSTEASVFGAADAGEVAAALFRPRPRQGSMDEPGGPSSAAPQHVNLTTDSQAETVRYVPTAYEQLPFDSAVEILLSMNPELSEEAAESACGTARSDVNLAQYLVDHAMAAPAVCRHLLSSGCYRADCQFSHDLENHTCLFWLKGRCGKGSSCQFRHGFNKALLDQFFGEAATEATHTEHLISLVDEEYPTPAGSRTSLPAPSDASSRSTSFASVAKGAWHQGHSMAPSGIGKAQTSNFISLPSIKIPVDVWTPHEARDSSVFHVADPLARYELVQAGSRRPDVIDLHFQSTKTFPTVLLTILPEKLAKHGKVWIVTGTGHHVGTKTHQKGGGALENAVVEWLHDEGYTYLRGRDRNGQGGAIYVESS